MEFLRACMDGDVETIKTMLESPTINQTIENMKMYDKGPLHISTLYGKIEIIKLLLTDVRFNPNQKCISGGFTPLIYACTLGKIEIVKLLLKDSRTDVNMIDVMGNSCLFYSCLFGKHELVEIILSDVRFNREDHKSLYEIYHVTCTNNRVEVIKLLMVMIDNYNFEIGNRTLVGNSETINVLNTFKDSPEYFNMRLKYNRDLCASNIFYNIVMLSDNYLKICDC